MILFLFVNGLYCCLSFLPFLLISSSFSLYHILSHHFISFHYIWISLFLCFVLYLLSLIVVFIFFIQFHLLCNIFNKMWKACFVPTSSNLDYWRNILIKIPNNRGRRSHTTKLKNYRCFSSVLFENGIGCCRPIFRLKLIYVSTFMTRWALI